MMIIVPFKKNKLKEMKIFYVIEKKRKWTNKNGIVVFFLFTKISCLKM